MSPANYPNYATNLSWKGAWSSSTTYGVNDAVSYGGSSWVSVVANNVNHTPAAGAYWALLAQAGSQGSSGSVGPQGPQGVDGSAATVSVGTVTTGEAGSSASVTNSGTLSAATLNFTIPRGDKGDTGLQGNPGAAATVGVGTTTTGAAGSSASVTNSGTSSAATLNFTIPRGDTGAQGNPGPSNTLSIGTVSTGTAGSSASASVTGTSPAQTLNLTIPRGDTGATGQQGSAGVVSLAYKSTGPGWVSGTSYAVNDVVQYSSTSPSLTSGFIVSISGNTLTGSTAGGGTQWQQTGHILNAGDIIFVNGNSYQITSVNSDTSLTITNRQGTSFSGQTYSYSIMSSPTTYVCNAATTATPGGTGWSVLDQTLIVDPSSGAFKVGLNSNTGSNPNLPIPGNHKGLIATNAYQDGGSSVSASNTLVTSSSLSNHFSVGAAGANSIALSGVFPTPKIVTTTQTLAATDCYVYTVTSGITLTLPSALSSNVPAGKQIVIANRHASAGITVKTATGEYVGPNNYSTTGVTVSANSVIRLASMGYSTAQVNNWVLI